MKNHRSLSNKLELLCPDPHVLDSLLKRDEVYLEHLLGLRTIKREMFRSVNLRTFLSEPFLTTSPSVLRGHLQNYLLHHKAGISRSFLVASPRRQHVRRPRSSRLPRRADQNVETFGRKGWIFSCNTREKSHKTGV